MLHGDVGVMCNQQPEIIMRNPVLVPTSPSPSPSWLNHFEVWAQVGDFQIDGHWVEFMLASWEDLALRCPMNWALRRKLLG